MDALLSHFPVRARMFHSGALCGVTDFSAPCEGGQIHLVRAGTMDAIHPGRPTLHVSVPSLLFYPRPLTRRFVTDAQRGADLVCAELHFDGGAESPIVGALPDVICLPLESIDGSKQILELLFEEAFSNNCGRYALVDRLFEVVLVQLLRYLMETDQIRGGMLAGLSHSKLRKALVAMHEQPGQEWSLEALAHISGMSRSVFAGTFRSVVGCTPGVYLQGWRVRLAQQALRQGRQLKIIAVEVGYGSEAALSRAFKAQCGMTPREWRQRRVLADTSES
ncbi:AraC family transcriptional regulator [Vogesella indigofera]|uniref:AraC family transcriptional regulator n=1 Tax=Vogesella indigofera TaxID=45465 RepID=UPI00234F8A0D|nr:AraC family transcriptional regulator [Vogesella indigofera]MDC7701699.1 AraC family transcriptional regulator [Vogesella indigofera]